MSDIFNSQDDQSGNSENAAKTTQADVFVEKLLDIKREDGTPKYESVEAALDALKASQDHIRTLETENATFKAKAQERDQLQETLERIQREKNVTEENKNNQTGVNSGLSEEAAERLIEQKLAAKQQEAVAINNVNHVAETLVKKFGSQEEANRQVAAKAKEIGLTPKALGELAQTAPNAVLAYFNEAGKSPISTNISSTGIPSKPQVEPIKAPDKSILSGPGATAKNQAELIRRIRANVYQENGIT